MRLRDALRRGANEISSTGSDEARIEAELLLCEALGVGRSRLYEQLNSEVPPEASAAFERLLARRLAHEPLAYVIGRREFFGRELEVSPAAIIPRPETETLVELAIRFARERFGGSPPTIADIGTGSGVIAVSLAADLPDAKLLATDLSAEALELARRNAERHSVNARISFLQGDLLEPLIGPFDVIAANLPYVRTSDWESLPPEIRDHEPRGGLDGGPDGMRVIERLLRQAPAYLTPGGALFAEIGDEQATSGIAIARSAFPQASIELRRDLAGHDRVLVVRS